MLYISVETMTNDTHHLTSFELLQSVFCLLNGDDINKTYS